LSLEFGNLISLLYSAVDLRRHITCEVCDPSVSGGYDPLLNQVAVCMYSCIFQSSFMLFLNSSQFVYLHMRVYRKVSKLSW